MATEPSTVIRLTLPELLRLTANNPDFQLSMFRLAANRVKRLAMVDRSLPKPSVEGIVHHTSATRPITARLARRLRDLDETPCIVGATIAITGAFIDILLTNPNKHRHIGKRFDLAQASKSL